MRWGCLVAGLSVCIAESVAAFRPPQIQLGSHQGSSIVHWCRPARQGRWKPDVRTMMSWRLPKRVAAPEVQGPRIDPCFQDLLSKRLGSVATLVPAGASVLDIGTDHAYLPIALLQAGRASKVIACDKNELPLENARSNFDELDNAIRDNLELRLGDGLSVLESGEADTVTTSGIGGKFIAEILFGEDFLGQNGASNRGRGSHPCLKELGISTLILQPTSYIEGLRTALYDHGWRVESETVFTEGRFLYITLRAKPSAASRPETHSDEDLFLGPVLRRLPPDAEERQAYAVWLRHQLSHYTSRRNGLRLMLRGPEREGGSSDSDGATEEGKVNADIVELQRQLQRAEWQVSLLEQELANSTPD